MKKKLETPTKDVEFFYEGLKAFANWDIEQAIDFFTKAIECNPSNEYYYSYRAYCYTQKRDLMSAIDDYEKALDIHPKYSYYEDCVQCCIGNGEQDKKSVNDILEEIGRMFAEEFEDPFNIRAHRYLPSSKIYKPYIPKRFIEKKVLKSQQSKIIFPETIQLKNCTFEQIITLFDADIAKKFIEQRDNGEMWYDIYNFTQSFELQPDGLFWIKELQQQDLIEFPVQKNKEEQLLREESLCQEEK